MYKGSAVDPQKCFHLIKLSTVATHSEEKESDQVTYPGDNENGLREVLKASGVRSKQILIGDVRICQ